MSIKNFKKNDSSMESKYIEQQQKQIKGGFKMKPTRFLIVAIVLLGMVATVTAAGALTPAGTAITNQATGNYQDANLNDMTEVLSNEVSTIVSQVGGIDVSPISGANTISAFGSTVYSVTVTNAGNGTDSYNLSALQGALTGTGTFSINIYEDTDASGDWDAGDQIISVTPSILMSNSYTFFVRVSDGTASGALEGDTHRADVTVTSVKYPAKTLTGEYTSTVAAADLQVTTSTLGEPDPIPGDLLTLEMCFENQGSSSAFNVAFVSAIPSSVSFKTGSIVVATVAQDDDATIGGIPLLVDNGDYNISTTGAVTGTFPEITSGTTVCVSFQVIVVEDLADGTDITFAPDVTFDDGASGSYPPLAPSVPTVTVTTTFGVTLVYDPLSTKAVGISYTGDPGDTWEYPIIVTNTGSHTDNFDLTYANVGVDFMTWEFYAVDVDGAATGTAIIVTGNMLSDAALDLIAIGTITAGTPDLSQDVSTLKSASKADVAGVPPANGTASATSNVTAPAIIQGTGGLSKVVSPLGEQPPGATLTYTIRVVNGGSGDAKNVVVTDNVPANTTYVSGSLTMGTTGGILTAVTDESPTSGVNPDSDGGASDGSIVTFTFGTLAASGDKSMTFQVVIDDGTP